jgi:cation transport ATPase
VTEQIIVTGTVTPPLSPGMRPDGSEHEESHSEEHHLEWTVMLRIVLVALACAAVWLRMWEPFERVSVIGLAAAVIGMFPILREAFEAVLERRMTMELSMTIAIGAALAIGQFFTALVIILFVLIAEVLEGMTVGRGRRAIKDLLNFLPRNATVRRQGSSREVSAAEIQVGDIVVVKPGSRIPVDGDVIAGNSFVDQSTITGESLPVEKIAGTHVYAATINQSGSLEVRTTGIGRDTAFGKIITPSKRPKSLELQSREQRISFQDTWSTSRSAAPR